MLAFFLFAASYALLWSVVAAVAYQTIPDILAPHRAFQKSMATTQRANED